MDKEKFIQIIKTLPKLEEHEIAELKVLSNKYTYCEVFPILIIKHFSNDLDKALEIFKKYTYQINNRKELIQQIAFVPEFQDKDFEEKVVEQQETDKKPAETINQQKMEEERNKRQEAHHNNILIDVIVPKVEKIINFNKLLKKSQYTEEELIKLIYNEPRLELQEKIESKSGEESEKTLDVKEELQTKVLVDTPSSEEKEQNKQDNQTINKLIDKISEIKKYKLQSEKIPTEQQIQEKLNEVPQITKEETEQKLKTGPEIEIKEEKKQEELAINNKPEITETDEKEKNEQKKEESKTQTSAADKILELLKSRKRVQNNDKKILDVKIENTHEEEITETIEQIDIHKHKIQDKDEKEKTIDQSPVEIDKHIEEDKGDEQIKSKEQKEEKPKTAADKILEKIANRRKKSEEIIEQFLETQPTIDRKKEPSSTEDLSLKNAKEPEIVSEQLAEIYISQNLYDEAIKIYEKLILKNPEKKYYFAQKIEELKKR